MSRESTPTSPIPSPNPQNDTQCPQNETTTTDNTTPSPMPVPINRSNRPSRACTIRTAQRLQAAAQAQAQAVSDRKPRKKELRRERLEEPPEDQQQCSANSKIVTPLVGSPPPSQQTRWSLRAMWELASILNFLHVFRQLLNISAEFTAEEFETALINPNDTLSDIHMPILKAIPPVTRMALTRDTWITVLCRKLRDWWHWVAEGDLPIVASHGTEIEVYKTLDPAVRVVILKALCDIRVEQDDIKSYIDKSVKHGVHLSAFRKERIGGDSFGINYWYEDDPVIGHRLYREIRKGEVKKAKVKGSNVLPNITYQWETVATNLEEFLDVSEKLFSSKNRTEASLGKKLKNDMLPEIEKEHKRKEKLLKKQQRQALLLDNFLVDGLGPGRSLRDRKPVTYTFDDYDRSINEAIKITKRKPPSPDPMQREGVLRHEASTNGKWSDPLHANDHVNFSALSPDSQNYDDADEENDLEPTDRSHRRRRRPQRYSVKEFVEAVSDNEADFDSDDDIVGEVVYDEEYLRKRKQRRKFSSSSEGDEEYNWDEENGEEEEEEEEEDSLSVSEESDDEPRKFKKLRGRTRRETKLKSVGELQLGLRRSKRATRTPINYRQYEMSESDTESARRGRPKSNVSDERSEASENEDYSEGSHDSNGNNVDEDQDMKIDFQPDEGKHEAVEQEQTQPPEQSSNPARELNSSPGREEVEGVKQRRFLDLNELAPASGFDDGPNTVKDENTDNF